MQLLYFESKSFFSSQNYFRQSSEWQINSSISWLWAGLHCLGSLAVSTRGTGYLSSQSCTFVSVALSHLLCVTLGAARGHAETGAIIPWGLHLCQMLSMLFPCKWQKTVPVLDSRNIGVNNSALFPRHLWLISMRAWLPLNIIADPDGVLEDILNSVLFSSLPKTVLFCQNPVLHPMCLRTQNNTES